MHYLHLGEQTVDYIIDPPHTPTQPSASAQVSADHLFRHWRWNIHREQPLPILLQHIAAEVPHAVHTPLHVVVNGAATIVPMADFAEEQCETHLQFVLPQPKDAPPRNAFYDVLPASNAVVIFGLDKKVCETIESLWGNAYFVSAQTGLLRRFAARQDQPHERRCFVHLRQHAVDVSCFEGNSLLAYNSFDAAHTADVVYYACQMATTLECSPSTTPFYLCGILEASKALAQTLKDFVTHIEVAITEEEFAHHPLTTIPQLPFEFLTHILST